MYGMFTYIYHKARSQLCPCWVIYLKFREGIFGVSSKTDQKKWCPVFQEWFFKTRIKIWRKIAVVFFVQKFSLLLGGWWASFVPQIIYWLVVSTHLKNISQNWESSPNRGENKKYLSYHHLVYCIYLWQGLGPGMNVPFWFVIHHLLPGRMMVTNPPVFERWRLPGTWTYEQSKSWGRTEG